MRPFRVRTGDHDPNSLEMLEPLGEDGGRDPGQLPGDIPEPAGPGGERIDDQERPAIPEVFEGRGQGFSLGLHGVNAIRPRI